MNELYVLGFDDNADGNAYKAEGTSASCLTLALEGALYLLNAHDHVVIMTAEAYRERSVDHTTSLCQISPYALILHCGSRFPLTENVNNL